YVEFGIVVVSLGISVLQVGHGNREPATEASRGVTVPSSLFPVPYLRAVPAFSFKPPVSGGRSFSPPPSSSGIRPIIRRKPFGSLDTRRHSSSVTSRLM